MLERVLSVRVAARKAICFIAKSPWLIVLWLWLSISFPIMAQEAEQKYPVLAPIIGEFSNLEENIDGQYSLQRLGPMVIATFSTSRSPVQYFARHEPLILFTIPEGYRPGSTVTWEVEGWPVQQDGSADSQNSEPRRFRLQVDPNGSVNYVDDSGVDGVGYLAYAARLTWPVAGAQTQVCSRSDDIQDAILNSRFPQLHALRSRVYRCDTCSFGLISLLKPVAPHAPGCVATTWSDLSAIRSLGFGKKGGAHLSVSAASDLAGLDGLIELALVAPESVEQVELLAQTPRLKLLDLRIDHESPLLADLLGQVPDLTHLTLDSAQMKELESDQPIRLPGLTHLVLKAKQLPTLPPGLLSDVPALTHLTLTMDQVATLPPDLLSHLPRLTHLILEADNLVALPEEVWSRLAQVTHLTLRTPKLDELPHGFLRRSAHLARIHRRGCGGAGDRRFAGGEAVPAGVEADGWGRVSGVSAPGGGFCRVAAPATAENRVRMAAGDAPGPAGRSCARRWRGLNGGAIREVGAGRASVPGRRGTGFAKARPGGDAR